MNWRLNVNWRLVAGALVLIIILVFAVLVWSRNRINWPEEYRLLYESVADETPLMSNIYNVYLDEDNRALIYVKEECTPNDLSAFYLHIDPAYQKDLPGYRRPYGFDNLDFDFYSHGLQIDGNCVINRYLPEYEIAGIRTGQYRGTGDQIIQIWRGETDIRIASKPIDETDS